jgi:hypothetical protein
MSNQVYTGIAYEGGLDTEYVQALIARLLQDKGYTFTEKTEMVKPGTAIVKFVPVYVQDFKQKGVELMVFLTDGDNEDDRRQQIRDAVRRVEPSLLDFCAVGIPKPHMEQWIMADEATLKAVFSLNGSEPLPFQQYKPKQQLMSIYKTSPYTGTLEEAKVQIAQTCNINLICSNVPEFNALKQDINNALNFIQSQR